MCAKWKYEPDRALSKIELTRRVNSKGKIEFPGVEFEDCLELLISSVSFASDLLESTAREIVHRSIFAAASKNKLEPRWVIGEITRLENEHAKKPTEKFYLAGRISIDSRDPISRIAASGKTIRFGREVPSQILEMEAKYTNEFTQGVNAKLPSEYMRFLVSTSGRSKSEAGWAALDTLDYFRALWNLKLNMRAISRSSSGRVKPVNQIVLGPLETLFTVKKALIANTWWIQHEWDGPDRALNVSQSWNNLRQFDKKATASLKNKSEDCRALIKKALLRYVRALDGRDYETVFLKLWGVLEHLTLTGRKDKYDTTIKRAAFLWKDSEFHRQILNHLRGSRNSSVHRDEFGARGEILVYQLKKYVEALLHFHIFTRRKYKSPEEIAEFLDLPPDPKSLSNRVRLIRWAIRFRLT